MYKEKKILLVEDEQAYRLDVCKYLGAQGLFVYAASNPDEFKSHLEKYNPDIAIIDRYLGYEGNHCVIRVLV